MSNLKYLVARATMDYQKILKKNDIKMKRMFLPMMGQVSEQIQSTMNKFSKLFLNKNFRRQYSFASLCY